MSSEINFVISHNVSAGNNGSESDEQGLCSVCSVLFSLPIVIIEDARVPEREDGWLCRKLDCCNAALCESQS